MDLNKKMHWNIAGGFVKHEIIMDYFTKNNLFGRYGHISVYDGIENCVWNGGRLHSFVPYRKEVKEKYYGLGWSINLTFTNPIIDLNDEKGNYLLEEFHKEGNSIILVNDDLRKYIKKSFPKYTLIHSITACGEVQGFPIRDEDLAFYKDKQDKFDVIIPRCDSTFDPRLKELDIDRLEILISDTCILNCPYFGDHFKKIAQHNESGKDASKEQVEGIGECWVPKDEFDRKTKFEKRLMGDKYPFYLSFKQIQNLVKDGFTIFKMQGREAPEEEYRYDLGRFMRDYNEEG